MSNEISLSIIILAAGQGKRMGSSLPKVLHKLAGKAMLEHVLQAANSLHPAQSPIIVYGYQGELVRQALNHFEIIWVEQSERLGTGHAVLQAIPFIPDHHHVLMLYGDVPLITANTLKNFINETPKDALGIITADFPDPTGIGRVLRDANNKITGVIEEKDASDVQRKLKEVNTGFYIAPAKYLKQWLPKLNNQNAQNEYYLTDIIALAAADNVAIHGFHSPNHQELLGINDAVQLVQAEQILLLSKLQPSWSSAPEL